MTDEAPRTEAILVRATDDARPDPPSLASLLRGYDVAIEHLAAASLWIVRGAPSVIAALRATTAPIADSGAYEIVPEGTLSTQ
ncbi:MAG: hypothetical protein JNK05_30920 [Myxococcales bacterium]|nr:hypothetical protein [Myxococcales bacterium]